jgi:hypothetical protein
MGAADFDGVRVAALLRQPSTLAPADPELLGDVPRKVLRTVLRTVLVAGVHDVPA